MKSGIYIIRNTVNGKLYVGSSANLARRWLHHRNYLRTEKHKNEHLQRAWSLYGEEVFEFCIIERVAIPQLLVREQFWIDFYKACDEEYGYNIALFADASSRGRKFSVEHKAKIGAANAKRGLPTEAIVKLYLGGMGRAAIGRLHGVAEGTIHKALLNARVPLRSASQANEARTWNLNDEQRWKMLARPKLSSEQVVAIRQAYAAGNVTMQQLAERFGLTLMPVRAIIRGHTWKHLLSEGVANG